MKVVRTLGVERAEQLVSQNDWVGVVSVGNQIYQEVRAECDSVWVTSQNVDPQT